MYAYSDPRTAPLIPSLAQLLSSPKKDEEISEEVAELLGFDAIELVMEVIRKRLPLSYKVKGLIRNPLLCVYLV